MSNIITHKLSKDEKKKVKNYLKGKDDLPEGGHSHIFTFPDSYYMEISVKLTSSNTPSCSALLYNENGDICGEIKGEDEFWGIWAMPQKDAVYIVDIRK